MGLYIKCMEIPNSCLQCPLFAGNGCNATRRIFPEWLNVAARPDTCPLVEVQDECGDSCPIQYSADEFFSAERGDGK